MGGKSTKRLSIGRLRCARLRSGTMAAQRR
jgi:hypothetical protein